MNPDLCSRRLLAGALLLAGCVAAAPPSLATMPAREVPRASFSDAGTGQAPAPSVSGAPVAPVAANAAPAAPFDANAAPAAPLDANATPAAPLDANAPAAPLAASAGPDLPQAWTGSQTVADLLRAEVQAQRAPAAAGPSVRERGVRVQAIYGIGRQLMADVAIDGDVQRFRSGQEQARRRDARAAGEAGESYRLQRIEPPCVVLRHGSDTLRTCLLGASEIGAVR